MLRVACDQSYLYKNIVKFHNIKTKIKGKLGCRTKLAWVRWVLILVNPALWILLHWQQTQQAQLKPDFYVVLMNPAKLGKVGFRTRSIWVT